MSIQWPDAGILLQGGHCQGITYLTIHSDIVTREALELQGITKPYEKWFSIPPFAFFQKKTKIDTIAVV